MEFGLASVHQEAGEKKYDIYVEEYVLAYLKKEVDTLALSEIFLYGQRGEDGKIFVYGAGREKNIPAFAKYELLTELVCRLTQAGPVFMMRGADGSCRAAGFQVFYENNEAMQSFLIGWTGLSDKSRAAGEKVEQEEAVFSTTAAETKKHVVHGAISVQLCLILVALVAIVISSADSYEKMEQLGQSAKEVFFAIENQETEETAGDLGEQKEIVVKRDTLSAAEVDKESTDNAADGLLEKPEEGILKRAVEKPEEEKDAGDKAEDDKSEVDKQEKGQQDGNQTEEEEEAEEEEAEEESSEEKPDPPAEEEGEEALSRSITRYYEVKQGDTLYTISREIYGDLSRVDKICEINQISDPDQIRSGQKIILP